MNTDTNIASLCSSLTAFVLTAMSWNTQGRTTAWHDLPGYHWVRSSRWYVSSCAVEVWSKQDHY